MPKTLHIIGLLALAAALVPAPVEAQRGLGQGKARLLKPRKNNPSADKPKNASPKKDEQPKNDSPAAETPQPAPAASVEVPPKAGKNVPPEWMERLQKMSPAEQERFLNNNERFRNLPPERKAEIRQRLQDFRQLSPEEREKFRERANVWEKITPDQRQRVRQEILPKWKQMAPDRREEIKRRLNALNGLGDEERAAKLKDPEFLRGLSPSEQGMLRDLSSLRVTAAPSPEGDR